MIIITYPKNDRSWETVTGFGHFPGQAWTLGLVSVCLQTKFVRKIRRSEQTFVFVQSTHQKPILEALQYTANVLMVALIQAILGPTSANDEIINVNAGAPDGIRNSLPHTISVLLTAPMVEHPVHHALELPRSIFHSHRRHPPLQGAQGVGIAVRYRCSGAMASDGKPCFKFKHSEKFMRLMTL